MTKPFNDDSRLAAEALRWRIGVAYNPMQEAMFKPFADLRASLGDKAKAVVDVALVERLIDAECYCAPFSCNDKCDRKLAIEAARAAGFGKVK